ncbi:hypothetical protein GY45DRAFT_1328826 [Cubamyces sp. BRFM 1775]|nr:hypothetical protein GY45DRAFT_1328826 [Cubamyces sp. BRFM 1775]
MATTKTVRPVTTKRQQQQPPPPAPTTSSTNSSNTSITLSLNLNSNMLQQLGVEPPPKASVPASQQAKPRGQPQVRETGWTLSVHSTQRVAPMLIGGATCRVVPYCRESLQLTEATRIAPRASVVIRPITGMGTGTETGTATATPDPSSVDRRNRARRTGEEDKVCVCRLGLLIPCSTPPSGSYEYVKKRMLTCLFDKDRGGRAPEEGLARRAIPRPRHPLHAQGLRTQGKVHR